MFIADYEVLLSCGKADGRAGMYKSLAFDEWDLARRFGRRIRYIHVHIWKHWLLTPWLVS